MTYGCNDSGRPMSFSKHSNKPLPSIATCAKDSCSRTIGIAIGTGKFGFCCGRYYGSFLGCGKFFCSEHLFDAKGTKERICGTCTEKRAKQKRDKEWSDREWARIGR